MNTSRIQLIDALRAFALLGITLAHSSSEYLGIAPTGYTNRFTALEKSFGPWLELLTFGKFFTIFSFLFGLSFYLQLHRGRTTKPRFLWRLTILGTFGFVHTLFFVGDILIVYAIAGLVLLLTPRLSTRTLTIAGLLLIFNLPIQLDRLRMQIVPASPQALAEEKQFFAGLDAAARENIRIKQSGSIPALISWNFHPGFYFKALFQLFSGRLFITIGLFFLGIAAGRLRLFEDTPLHRLWARRALAISLPTGLLATWLTYSWNPTLFGSPREFYPCLGLVSFDIQQIALSLAYACAFILFCWRFPAHTLVFRLHQVGRMGLTVYLLMSLTGLYIFYGFGLGWIGRVSLFPELAFSLLATLAVFALANLWMTYFQQGPVEWLWRTLTNLSYKST